MKVNYAITLDSSASDGTSCVYHMTAVVTPTEAIALDMDFYIIQYQVPGKLGSYAQGHTFAAGEQQTYNHDFVIARRSEDYRIYVDLDFTHNRPDWTVFHQNNSTGDEGICHKLVN